MATITFEAQALEAALSNLTLGLTDMSQVMNQIGEAWVQSTQERIESGETPDGTAFAPRSQATLDGYGRRKPPVTPIGGPLRLTGDMGSQIHHDYGDDYLEVGSGAIQAAMMQFGGAKSAYPNLWGDIPARPFIGVSEQDEIDGIEIIEDYLDRLVS